MENSAKEGAGEGGEGGTSREEQFEKITPAGRICLIFTFPDVQDFPPAPAFVGGEHEFPSNEEARIQQILASTFSAFKMICPDFENISVIITEQDKRNKVALNEQIKRKGSRIAEELKHRSLPRETLPPFTAEPVPSPPSAGSTTEESGSVTARSEQEGESTATKKERRKSLLFKRKSATMEQLVQAEKEKEETEKGRERKMSIRLKKKDKDKDKEKEKDGKEEEKKERRGTLTRRKTEENLEKNVVQQRSLSTMLSPEEVAKYKEMMIKKYESQQQETLRATSKPAEPAAPPSTSASLLRTSAGATRALAPAPAPTLTPPPNFKTAAGQDERPSQPDQTTRSNIDLSFAAGFAPPGYAQASAALLGQLSSVPAAHSVATPPDGEVEPVRKVSSVPVVVRTQHSPRSASPGGSPRSPRGGSSPRTSPRANSKSPRGDESQEDASNRRWSLKGKLTSLRPKKEQQEDEFVWDNSKYAKHMMSNPLNDLL